jgi:hypothetical protein
MTPDGRVGSCRRKSRADRGRRVLPCSQRQQFLVYARGENVDPDKSERPRRSRGRSLFPSLGLRGRPALRTSFRSSHSRCGSGRDRSSSNHFQLHILARPCAGMHGQNGSLAGNESLNFHLNLASPLTERPSLQQALRTKRSGSSPNRRPRSRIVPRRPKETRGAFFKGAAGGRVNTVTPPSR